METSAPKLPGELNDTNGLGNDEFDALSLSSKPNSNSSSRSSTSYAYPVHGLLKLATPLTREVLQTTYGVKPTQSFCYASRKLVEAVPLGSMQRVDLS